MRKTKDRMKQRITIKALTPVNKSHINTIINTTANIQGIVSIKLEEQGQYNFSFVIEHEIETDSSDIAMQIRTLLKTYGSTILSTNKEQIE